MLHVRAGLLVQLVGVCQVVTCVFVFEICFPLISFVLTARTSDCEIQEGGGKALVEGLRNNTTLTSLNLNCNCKQ